MTHEFKVEDMTCGHCVSRASRSRCTRSIPEATVATDLASRTVAVDGAADRRDYGIRDSRCRLHAAARGRSLSRGAHPMKAKYFELAEARSDGLVQHRARRRGLGRVGEDDPPLRIGLGLLPTAGAHATPATGIYRRQPTCTRCASSAAPATSASRSKEIGELLGAVAATAGARARDVKQHRARRTSPGLDSEASRELQAMQRHARATSRSYCHGDDRPDCPILEDLAAEHDAQCHHGKRPTVRGARAHGGEPSAPASARGRTSASRTKRFS